MKVLAFARAFGALERRPFGLLSRQHPAVLVLQSIPEAVAGFGIARVLEMDFASPLVYSTTCAAILVSATRRAISLVRSCFPSYRFFPVRSSFYRQLIR